MKLFIYGTLKRGRSRAHVLKHQNFLGPAVTLLEYRLYDCGSYPGLVCATDGDAIEGELWDVGEPCMRRIDAIEGTDEGLFRRERVRLQPPHDVLAVMAYFHQPSVAGLSECGTCW
jgi:gamma-glutamylcyclotransferase (GGCT)/AIG2-like uncharacterized protein YtfP